MSDNTWTWNQERRRHERGRDAIVSYHQAFEGVLAFSSDERLVVCPFVASNDLTLVVQRDTVYQLKPTARILSETDAEPVIQEFRNALEVQVEFVPPSKVVSVRDALQRKRELREKGPAE